MAYCIAQITLDRKGGLPADAVVNTLHFEDDSGFGTDAGFETNGPGLVDRLVTFYQALGPAILGFSMAGTGRVALYDHSQPTPRVPLLEQEFTHTVGSGIIPGEVALCLSYRGAREAGVAMARRRGRIFLGTLGSQVMPLASSTADIRVKPSALTDTLNAARTMALGGSGAFRLAVYSPTIANLGGSLDDAYSDVTHLWMDDAFDTIRSRGARATTRYEGTVGGTEAFATV